VDSSKVNKNQQKIDLLLLPLLATVLIGFILQIILELEDMMMFQAHLNNVW
jgi:hypothetical protein